MRRLLVSAAHKSSGKTTVCIGLAAALAARGEAVQPFKKGPDYIDPIWLALAAGRPCYNLDPYLSSAEEIQAAFVRRMGEPSSNPASRATIGLIEGNKGLHDGLDLHGSNSNAALAVMLGAPVVLVIDARGMTRGIAPIILGFQAFEPRANIAGVILNQLGGSRHESKLRAVIEHYTSVPVIGAIARDDALAIEERHLGLVPANEAWAARERIRAIAGRVAADVDLERLLELAASASPLAAPSPGAAAGPGGPPVRIAFARDEAFGFYYADDLEALREAGAQMVPFDTMRDRRLPRADGLFIGGGFPEARMGALSANAELREDIRTALAAGLPAYAECGGLMYLARAIEWKGRRQPMVGAIGADIVMRERPVGRGYVHLKETGAAPWRIGAPGASVRAHEFHYSSVENLAPGARFAYEVERGHGIDGRHDGLVQGNLLASFAHLRSVAGSRWAPRFVEFVRGARACAPD